MRITHVIPVYAPAWQFGGPVLSVSRLCEALANAGHKVRVLTTNAGLPNLRNEELGKVVNRNGVDVTYFEVDRVNGPIRSRDMERSLTASLRNSDLIHLSTIWQPLGIAIQKEAYRLKIPVIQSLRGALSPYSLARGWWKKIPYYYLKERPWLEKAAGLHVTTYQEKNELAKLRLKTPCHLLANPIDLENLQINTSKGLQWRKKYNIKSDTPLFLICGRQHHKKGLDMLPGVFRQLANFHWKLIIVGNDDDGLKLKEIIKKVKNLTSNLIIDSSRCTTKKTRYVCENQQILRVDKEIEKSISTALEIKIIKLLKKKINDCNVIVLSDYNKGILTENLIKQIIKIARAKKKILIVDPKKKTFLHTLARHLLHQI